MGPELGLPGGSGTLSQFRRIYEDPHERKADSECYRVLWEFRATLELSLGN